MTREELVRLEHVRPAARASLLAAALGATLFVVLTVVVPVWPLPPARIALLVAIVTSGAAVLAPKRLRVALLGSTVAAATAHLNAKDLPRM